MSGVIDSILVPSRILMMLYIINFFIALAIIFLERKDPQATLAWIAVLFGLPAIGILLYFFFSQNIARKKIYVFAEDEVMSATNSLQHQHQSIKDGTFAFSNDEALSWQDLIELNQNYGAAYLTQDNAIEIFDDGKQMFDEMLADIRAAKESINVMFFILKKDEMGHKIIRALAEKAREGVRVKLLLDALGSWTIGERFAKDLIDAGGRFATFFPPRSKFMKLFNSRFNYRNHRKIVTCDGRVGYIGGFNVAREYIGKKKRFGYWRDTQLRIRGGSVQDLEARFLIDWRQATEERESLVDHFHEPDAPMGNSAIQIVSSGPDSPHEEIKRAFLKMITHATDHIYIQTPYFVPDAPILESLKMAAQSGIEVKLMIPCMPDHAFVYWATYSYVGELIHDGGKVYIYDAGFLHSKVMIVDGEVATVGSTNFDIRSFRLNFESNAFIYDKDVARHLEEMFAKDIEKSHELTLELYETRSVRIKIKEAISRLISAIL